MADRIHWIAVWHKCCDRVAFYYDHVPRHGETLQSEHAITVVGTRPRGQDTMRCGGCGNTITLGEDKRVQGLEIR